ncbi:MAG: Rdx family protein [Candidatus Eiseniibacteriota bacterium]
MAAGLAAAIEKEFGVRVKQVASDGGVFDVEVDGQLVYSKHETGRHIKDHEEVLRSIRKLQKA